MLLVDCRTLDGVNELEQPDQTQVGTQPKTKLAEEHFTASHSDRSSIRKPQAQDIPHIDIGEWRELPEDASAFEQDLDALAHMLGSSLPKRLAQSLSTGSAHSSQWAVADESQFSGESSGRNSPNSTAASHVSQPCAADFSNPIHSERDAGQTVGHETQMQHDGTAHRNTTVSRKYRSSERKAQSQCITVANPAEPLDDRAEAHQDLDTLRVQQGMVGSNGLSISNDGVHSDRTFAIHTHMYSSVNKTADFDRPQIYRAPRTERHQSEVVSQVNERGEAQVALSLPAQTDMVMEIDDKEYEPLTPYQLAATAAASACRERSAQRARATLSRQCSTNPKRQHGALA